MIPDSMKPVRRVLRMLVAISSERKSLYRVAPPNRDSLMISRLHRSPTNSSARAAEQISESYVFPSTEPLYPIWLHDESSVGGARSTRRRQSQSRFFTRPSTFAKVPGLNAR